MIKKSVNSGEYFEISDENNCTIYYGCNQQWYKKPWQRMSGCGPTTASNIILYNKKSKTTSKIDSVILMDEMWKYVTPTLKGVNTTKIFYEGLKSYAKSKGAESTFDVLEVAKDKNMRPTFIDLTNFIKNSLENDVPLAFLNLCNGEEKCLDKWHWVTVVSLEYEEDGSTAFIEILDEGMKKTIDLLLWFKTTTLGGGFVSFSFNKLNI